MDDITILAQTAQTTAETTPQTPLVPIDYLWEQIITLSWLQAIVAVSFGAVYLLYGWRIFRILVVICSALVGLFIGIRVGAHFDLQIVGGVTGLLVLAVISVPLMRWAVCLLGAAAGGILAGGVWYASELPGKYILAGAIIGVIAGGMISFIVFKIAVMLFTGLGAGILIITGLLSLLNHYESVQEPPTETIKEMFYNHNWFLPVLLMIPTAIGIILQNKFIKHSKDWDL